MNIRINIFKLRLIKPVVLTGLWIACGSALHVQGQSNSTLRSLSSGFATPPESAKPRTFWHWTGGNITPEGITKDLEWMKRVGIGGVQISDLSAGCCQTIAQPVPFHSPAWYEDVKLAASQAQQLGLEVSLFSSAGWSLAGGPWVTPRQAMKKLVWSDTTVTGPATFSAVLPHPPTVNGPFQDITHARRTDPTYYGEVAVVAYPTPEAEQDLRQLHPAITTSGGTTATAGLFDDNLNTTATLKANAPRGACWLQLAFPRPVTVRAFSVAAPRGIPYGQLLASTDGVHFTPVCVMPGPQNYRGGKVRTFAFPAVTARYFKVTLTGGAPSPAAVIAQPRPQSDSVYVLSNLRLHTGARVNRWEDKAGFDSFLDNYTTSETPDYPAMVRIDTARIVNLSARMDTTGHLSWTVPPGRWTIMRFGYSLTGAKNRPARPGGLGYEVDKLNPAYVTGYLHGYLDTLAGVLGPLFGTALSHMTLDSWEADMQNWTPGMRAAFQQHRGYDLTSYLPVLAGRVVGSAALSDRFSWDFRRTLADMFAENFYGTVTGYLHTHNIKTYGEASGVSLVIPEDALLTKKQVDIPMGEFWVHHLHPESMYYMDIRGAASAAHVYGKPLVGAESFTGGGYQDPYTLKGVADYWFTQGVNRIVLHNSALQPLDTKPGNMMVGTNFNRNSAWGPVAGPFMRYLGRTSYMLQRGSFVADLCYLLKEGAPSTMPFWGAGLRPPLPAGYDYDFINVDVLNQMRVDASGALVLPSSMRYRLLVLPPTSRMTLPVLRRIARLVREGATILGPKPQSSPTLAGYPEAGDSLRALADDLWGDINGISLTRHYYGKGMVVWGLPPGEVLEQLGVPPDVRLDKPVGARFSWIHRREGTTDIYLVSNLTDSIQRVGGLFRSQARYVSVWDPVTGAVTPVQGDTTGISSRVPLALPRHGSAFVVFSASPVPVRGLPPLVAADTVMAIGGPWQLRFPPRLGAPPAVTLPELTSWTQSTVPGIKYFSGTATYTTHFRWTQGTPAGGSRILLDLGEVKDIAEVSLNGRPLDTLWAPPFRTDITGALKQGDNTLEVQVTNLWINRLLGDRELPEGRRILSSGLPRFGRPPTLQVSGLLGPVKIEKTLATH